MVSLLAEVGNGYVELGDLLLEVDGKTYPILDPKAIASYAIAAGVTLSWDVL